MPTVRQNISYYCKRIRFLYPSVALRLLRVCAILLLVAAALETFVFNFNYFASRAYNAIDMSEKIELDTDEKSMFRITELHNVIEFENLNTEVHNLFLDFDSSQAAQNLGVKIQFTDEAHHTYFDTTEYTEGTPEVFVSTMSKQSQYINLNTYGYVSNLRIEITGDEVSYPISLQGIVLNAHRPFSFNLLRFSAVFCLLILAFIFRPTSSIYRIGVVGHAFVSKLCVVAAACVEILLVTAYLFYGSNLVGIATSSYNYGAWDGVSLVNSFEVGGDNAQQYAELARAMTEGHLYLDREVPQWLQDMDDPYDKGARDERQKESDEQYLFDVAYFDGRYYVYFGVVPVLLFYLPFYVITGADFPTAAGVLLAAIAFILGCTLLLDRFARYHFKRVSLGLYLLLQIPLIFCCGILYLVKFPTFYSLPIMCALAFSVWGLYFWMRGRRSKHAGAWYVAGSSCMALVLGCRPQLMVLSLVACPLFWRTYIGSRRLLTEEGVREFACLCAPYAVVFAGIMWYNAARFGSPFDFGANYNLTVNDMTKRGFSLGRLAPAFFAYFLQTPNITGVFPFIQAAVFETSYMGQTIKEVTFGGIFACLPLLWLLPFAPRILALRTSQRSTHTIAGVTVVLLASGIVLALLDAELAGILQRYYADFSFMFLAAAVLLVFIVNENIASSGSLRSVATGILLMLSALSVTYSALICFVPETGWYSDVYPWAYQDLIEMFMFWT